jgi:hypothetical protein
LLPGTEDLCLLNYGSRIFVEAISMTTGTGSDPADYNRLTRLANLIFVRFLSDLSGLGGSLG